MSQKNGNRCATYTIPLNISENDIFCIGRAYLQHFMNVNVKMDDDCKPMMLKMHLELDDSPSSIGEAAERNIEQNNSSINGLRQSVQQLEEEMKALKDALLQAKRDDVVNRIDQAPNNIDNNATQESNSNKQANNENKLSGEHNDTDSVASASEERHTNAMPKEKPNVIDLRKNCVYIRDFQCSDLSLEKAFCNIRKLANEMNVEIPYDSVIHIDMWYTRKNSLDCYVYFCNAGIKKEFLRNRHFLIYNPQTNPTRILDYEEWGIVDIKNFQSSDLSLETAYVNVIGIAEKMGIKRFRQVRNFIDHIDVFSTTTNFLTYSVRFNREFMRMEFLHRRDILKQFPETKSLEILDAGGYNLDFRDVDNVSMTVAGANVIGMAKLIDLSLTIDHIKRIYVLNPHPDYEYRKFSLIVEFSSKQVKDEFLEKKNKLKEMEDFKYRSVEISNINAEKNVVSIKYARHTANVISFIGFAKQLGFSLTPDQIQHYLYLAEFI